MRTMSGKEKRIIQTDIRIVMRYAVSDEYARHILEHENEETEKTFMDDVIDDVMCTSAWNEEGYYNADDIRLSIGRIFMERLGIEV